jgi:hypothetical protein
MPTQPILRTTRSKVLLISVIVVLTVVALVSLRLQRPTPPKSLDASLQEFSAARALPLIRTISAKPHAIGTTQQQQVSDTLLETLRTLGYEPELQSDVSVFTSPRHAIAGKVSNILVRVRGTAGTGKALLLVAHYDSVPTGPGAADDGASVAAIVESLRALKQSPPLRDDLIVLLTDGEEAGLLGANLFLKEHPWARDVGLVLNFEYRGNSGAMTLFQTGRNNADQIKVWSNTPHPIGDSLFAELYSRLPNDTDLSVFLQAGIPGLNFAAAEGHTAYHTRLDTPERLDLATLQDEGGTMLALIRAFNSAAPRMITHTDRVFFNLPLVGVITYPTSWAEPVAAIAVIAVLIGVVVGLIRRRLRVRQVLFATGACLTLLGGLLGVAQAIWLGLLWLVPGYSAMPMGSVYNGNWYLAAIAFLAVGIVFLYAQPTQRWRNEELSAGGLICVAGLTAAVAVLAPSASHVLAWPLLAMALVALFGFIRRTPHATEDGIGIVSLGVGLMPAVLFLVPLIHALYVALTPRLLSVTMAVIGLTLMFALPLIARLPSSFYRLALVLGAVCLGAGVVTSGFDAARPRPNELFFVQYDSAGKSLWLSDDAHLDNWTGGYLVAAKLREVPEVFGKGPWRLWAAKAPNLNLPPPRIEALEDFVVDGVRTLKLRIVSQRQAPKLRIFVEGLPVSQSELDGHPFSTEPRKQWMAEAYGFGAEGLRLDLHLNAGKPFRLKVVDVTYGIPPGTGAKRPDDTLAVPSPNSDTTQTIAYASFN